MSPRTSRRFRRIQDEHPHTNKLFKDDWVFAIAVRNGKVTKIREYIDTQALARASQMDASGLA